VDWRYQIIGELINKRKIAPERIINYEPVIKRRSCMLMEKSITLGGDNEHFVSCFVADSPRVKFNGNYKELVENISSIYNKFIQHPEQFKACASCGLLREDYYPLKPHKWHINYCPSATCNYNCCYCAVVADRKQSYPDGLPMGSIIKAAKSTGLLAEDYVVWIAGGEPTIQKYSHGNYEAFDGFSLDVGTNGSKLDYHLYDMMNKYDVRISISLDAGTPETYAKVKGRDLWDKVMENIEEYNKARFGIVHLKYVFLPGINDNEDDVDGFIDVCVQKNIPVALCSYDNNKNCVLTDRTIEMMKRLYKKLYSAGVLCVPSVVYNDDRYQKIAAEIYESFSGEIL
jgi:sulfatase maturation enzyme AslB (radical SAM superfamily)